MPTRRGTDGNDLFIAEGTDEVFVGRDGFDTVSFQYAHGGVSVNLASRAAQDTGFGVNTFRSIEQVWGSRFDDDLRGSWRPDQFFGDDGDDALYGRGGDDILQGGNGNDFLHGGSGFDFAAYWEAAEGVRVDLRARTQDTSGLGTDTLVAIEGLFGSSFGDWLSGNGGDNVLYGEHGNDRLYGRGGDDELYGGSGNDFLDGGTGANILEGGGGRDTIVIRGGGETADGGAGTDVFVLRGGSETETGESFATLRGGDGGARYVVRDSADGLFASIRDFGASEGNQLDFRSLDADLVSDFSGGGSAEVTVSQGRGGTTVTADFDGDGDADFTAFLSDFFGTLDVGDEILI